MTGLPTRILIFVVMVMVPYARPQDADRGHQRAVTRHRQLSEPRAGEIMMRTWESPSHSAKVRREGPLADVA
jgi:hypothetical protein